MSDFTPFEDMKNDELAQLVADFNLTVDAKNPAKPNKTEYVTALNAFKAKQDASHGKKTPTAVEAEENEGVEGVDYVVHEGEKLRIHDASSTAELIRADLLRKERVIVIDLRESQTREPSLYVNWGNRVIGNKTDLVSLDGKPQYIRRGAIINLEATRLTIHEPDDTGADKMTTRNRYVITRVAGMTQRELDELAAKQNLRNSKH